MTNLLTNKITICFFFEKIVLNERESENESVKIISTLHDYSHFFYFFFCLLCLFSFWMNDELIWIVCAYACEQEWKEETKFRKKKSFIWLFLVVRFETLVSVFIFFTLFFLFFFFLLLLLCLRHSLVTMFIHKNYFN